MVLISYFAAWKFWCIFFIAILKTKLFYHHLSKGLFTWRWGTPGTWGNPLRWGNPPVHIFSHSFDHVYMIGGVTRQGGSPGLPDRVTLSAGVKFYHVIVSRWGNPPSRGRILDTSNSRKIHFGYGFASLLKVTIEWNRTEGCSKSSKWV